MAKLTEEQIADFNETFSLFDKCGDGKIYASQLGEVLRALYLNPTEAEVRKCGYHNEPDYRISFEQFLPIYSTISKNQVRPTFDDFVEGMRVFDKEQNGTISQAELRHVLTSLGEKLSDDEVEQLLAGHDDSHGLIAYEEFIKSILNG